MNKNGNYFLFALFLLLLLVAGSRFKQYVLNKDFNLVVDTSCDPLAQNCFIANCAVGPDCDTTPYEKVTISEKIAPACLKEHTCENFSCNNKSDCSIVYCSSNSVADGERCSVKTN